MERIDLDFELDEALANDSFDVEGGTTVRDQYSNYITKKLSQMYKKRIVPPTIFLGLLIIIAIIIPVFNMYLPKQASGEFSPDEYYQDNYRYVNAYFDKLYFTGYSASWLGKTRGYYYYTIMDEGCYIVLISPESCKQGLPTIDKLNIKCQIRKRAASESELLSKLSKDLSWSKSGINDTISSYVLSQPGATGTKTTIFKLVYALAFIYTSLSIILYAICIFYPGISPEVLALRPYGKPSELLAQAEEEVATLPQLATEDMFITEHFFVETSSYGVAIVPIDKILWIYKHSTLHKILWHHFAISYTLHITADKRQYIKCPKNDRSDIDGVIEYLAEANHNILVGFNEENRKRVSQIQDSFFYNLINKIKH